MKKATGAERQSSPPNGLAFSLASSNTPIAKYAKLNRATSICSLARIFQQRSSDGIAALCRTRRAGEQLTFASVRVFALNGAVKVLPFCKGGDLDPTPVETRQFRTSLSAACECVWFGPRK